MGTPWRGALAVAVLLALGACVPSVFDGPYPVAPVELPRDDARHPAPMEWWYCVGHLETEDGRRLGFQLTLLEAYVPPQLLVAGTLPGYWLVEKGLLAHAAITDLDAGGHAMEQRHDLWERSGHASREEFAVWLIVAGLPCRPLTATSRAPRRGSPAALGARGYATRQ